VEQVESDEEGWNRIKDRPMLWKWWYTFASLSRRIIYGTWRIKIYNYQESKKRYRVAFFLLSCLLPTERR
jgi:hypothetical protein